MALPGWQRTIVTAAGDIVANAEIHVVVEATGLDADIYSDRDGTTPLTNPFFSDSNGFAQFYAAPGEYRITATGPSGSVTWRYVVLIGLTTDNNFTGNNEFSGTNDFSGTNNFDEVNANAYLSVGETNPISAWDSGTTYTIGDVISRYGKHFTSTGLTGNLNKDPINPANINYWYPSPGIDKLIDMFMAGEVVRGGMHKVNNLGDADYSTSLLLDKATFGGTTYEFYRVALDGSVVTGDATLEGILNTLSGTLYPHADIFAPNNLGTRTLVDMRGRGVTSMTTGGGEADIHGQVRDDQMQGHWHNLYARGNSTGVGLLNSRSDAGTDPNTNIGNTWVRSPVTDGTNGTPRTGATTHGADIVEGIKYIIVMKAA